MLAMAGCPRKDITIYRKLTDPAQKTCDANQRYRVEAKGADANEARQKAEAEIRSVITQNNGCGAFIWNEGSGKALDGTFNHAADYQFCRCQ
jgi:hypothetical protein